MMGSTRLRVITAATCLVLIVALAIPHAHAGPMVYELRLTQLFFELASGQGPLDVRVQDIVGESQVFVGSLVAEAGAVNTTIVLTDLVSFSIDLGGELHFALPCPPGACFVGFPGDTPTVLLDPSGHDSDIMGIMRNFQPPILALLAFDVSFPITNTSFEGQSLFPNLQVNVTQGECLAEEADFGFRSVRFGTYTITRVPLPATLFLLALVYFPVQK